MCVCPCCVIVRRPSIPTHLFRPPYWLRDVLTYPLHCHYHYTIAIAIAVHRPLLAPLAPSAGYNIRPLTHNGHLRDALYHVRAPEQEAHHDRRRRPEVRAPQVDPLLPGRHRRPLPRLAQRVRPVPRRGAPRGTSVPCSPPRAEVEVLTHCGRLGRTK